MADLTAAFRAHAPAALRETGGDEIGQALNDLVARGAAAWPALPIDPAALVAQAARHLPAKLDGETLPELFAALEAADLHLSCACAAGSAPAMAAFERTCLDSPSLRGAIRRIDRSDSFADDVRQAVREKLLVGAAGAPLRIGEYSGRWPLSRWLRVIAAHTAVDLLRKRRAGDAGTSDDRSAEQLAASGGPELRYLKDLYGKAFREAVAKAFATLDDEQCNLLRLQIVDGLRTAQIATLFRVDRSTIKRRLAACRLHLLNEIRRTLHSTLHLTPAEVDSLAGLVQSQLDVSLVRLLQR